MTGTFDPAWGTLGICVATVLVNAGINLGTLRQIKAAVEKLDKASEHHGQQLVVHEGKLARNELEVRNARRSLHKMASRMRVMQGRLLTLERKE